MVENPRSNRLRRKNRWSKARRISWRSRAAFENATFEPALRFYSKVLEYNPGTLAAWTAQVRMLIELGEFREAKLWANKALERFPNEPECSPPKRRFGSQR